MDKRIEKSLEANTGITEEFEELSRECFERIFDMLGKKNFERWINKRQLAPRIKELVIESMTDKEKRDNPHWAGYYTRGTNRIRLSEKKSKGTATHEKFHFMTDNGGNFSTFIDEGLTEYLKSFVEKEDPSYQENVDVVKYLHYICGDSIIKAYLLGNVKVFDNKICSLLADDREENQGYARKRIDKFYDNLNIFHEYKIAELKYMQALKLKENGYSESELTEMEESVYESEQRYRRVEEDIFSMFQEIAVEYISKMAKNFEFYKNGTLDVNMINKTIMEILQKIPVNSFTSNMVTSGALKERIAKLAAREIVENTHLAMLDEDTQDELADKIGPQVKYSRNSSQISSGTISGDNPNLKVDESKIFETFSTLLLKRNNRMDITIFLERLAVFQDKFNISDTQIDFILTKYNITKFSNSDEVVKINSAIKSSFPLFRSLFRLEKQREQDTVSTRENTFRVIDKNRYFEIRDNQRFLLEIGENGEIIEEEIKYGRNIIFRGQERLEINYKNGMDDVEFIKNGKKIIIGIPVSFREIKDLNLGNSILKIVEEKLEKGEYLDISDDAPDPYRFEGIKYTGEVDTRSRKIDFEKLIEDLQSIQKAIPESVRQGLYEKFLFSVLDKTYGTRFEQSDEIADIYFEIRDNFGTILNKNINDNTKKRFLDRMFYSAEQLNRIRIERVKESAKTAAISFKTPEAQAKYMENLRHEKILTEAEENKKRQLKITNFDYGNFIEYDGRTTEEMAYSLSGVYTTDDIDTRNRKVNVVDFANSIIELMKEIPKDIQEQFFESIFSKMWERAYGVSQKDLESNNDIKTATQNIRSAINSRVFKKEEIDEESLIPDFELLNKFHKELAESNKAHSLIAFKDENTRKMFDIISKIVESGVTEGEMGTQIRSLIEIHNDMMKSKENKNDSREQK